MSECNQLYFGDNLRVLRDRIADASEDLPYLGPPFNGPPVPALRTNSEPLFEGDGLKAMPDPDPQHRELAGRPKATPA